MPSLVLPILFLYTMVFVVFGLYYLIEVYEENKVVKPVEVIEEDYETTRTFSHGGFVGNNWLFTDFCIIDIIRYMRMEMEDIKLELDDETSFHISYSLIARTSIVEEFIKESKRGKYRDDLYNQITDIAFKNDHEIKSFLIRDIFKSIHNALIDDLLRKKK